MSKSLFVTSTEPRSGKSVIVLGLAQMLMGHLRKVAFYRPVINEPAGGAHDQDIDLILGHFKLNQPYERTHTYTLREVRDLLNEGKDSQVLETILADFKKLESEYDFVLCEGTDYLGAEAALEFDLNAEIAANLGAPVVLVVNGRSKADDEVVAASQRTIEAFEDKGLEMVAVVVNRAEVQDAASVASQITCKTRCEEPLQVYVLPEESSLGNPTVRDVQRWLNAKVLYGHGSLDSPIDDYLVAAMQMGNFLPYIRKGNLIITPGDRSDIILASLASRLSQRYPDISGILLTGGLEPPDSVHKLIEGWTGVPVPILSVREHTYLTTQIIHSLYSKIHPDDQYKVATALGWFDSHVDTEALRQRVVTVRSTRVTPKMFEYNLIEKARSERQRIVLPEGTGDRILRAADILGRRGVADIILLGDQTTVQAKASALNLDLSHAQVIDPAHFERFDEYAQTYFELRKKKGIREEDARDRMRDPTYFGTMMVYKGDADGMVSGSETTTAHTIRPAFEFIKTKPGFSIVSSVFLMCLRDRVLVFGDCAVNPDPNSEQLAEIAISSAHTAMVFGIEPRVAMLSYSTGSSGKGEQVEKVIRATAIAQERAPELLLEGPLQYDAAIDPQVAATKLPGSQVAGRATVFIFPDLNTGNNTYKAVQRSAVDSVAIGPVLQGLNKPVNDLSRGCTVPDIVNTVAITAIQAQAEKHRAEQGSAQAS